MQNILLELGGGDQGNNRGYAPFSVIAAEASNSVIIQGSEGVVARAVSLIRQLDVSSGLRRETRVLRLSHTDAASILPILQEIASGTAAEEDTPTNVEATIALHEPSNALIVSAVPETLAALTQVTAELDKRRKQVLVEAIIVDVSDTAARELGLQFLVAGEGSNVPFASSTFSSAAPSLLALTGAIAGEGTTGEFGAGGVDLFEQAAVASLLGLTGGTLGFGGQSNGTLFSVVLNALETDVETNVLSTPSIMALNNQPALVSVGQEIPISSGQVLGDANINPFQTTERREIGVILNVTPRIGDDNTIRLDIDQEVSSIAAQVGTVTTDFILNQNQLQTSIIADNGEMIVLGGLIQASDVITVDKVPLLGDVPLLGRLFQNEQTSRDTSNLMVFIRPTIIEDADDAKEVTGRTYNYIRAQQILANNGGPASLDTFTNDVFNNGLAEGVEESSPESLPNKLNRDQER
jgi:general secretion pathway protein D